MKKIQSVTEDIYKIMDSGLDHDPSAKLAADYAMRIGGELAKSTLKRDAPRKPGALWASDLGKKCHRQLWYKFHEPDKGASLAGHTKFKFLYGNILEEAVLYMAEEAGHKVEYQQERVEYDVGAGWTVSGRIDGVIDGTLMDVKTTSSYGFTRYKAGITDENDSFGYIAQLGFYRQFNEFKPKPIDQGFLWIDKQNGHIAYTPCVVPTRKMMEHKIEGVINSIELSHEPPKAFAPEPYGKSGNMKLPIGCAYCDFNKHCHRDANGGKGLRTFIYGHGPVYLTDVVNEPRVPEAT